MKNLKRKIKKKVSKDYEPINWFIDYKSGFYFEPLIYNSVKKNLAVIGNKCGIDIKCPWELGRLQHLVQLAVFAVYDKNIRNKIIQEFRDEIYDFIISNPIGKTVQWSCAMDVSIRLTNILVSYDLLKQIDTTDILNSYFDIVFEKFVFESAEYVLQHLEYAGKNHPSGNHYLADLVGIVFAGAYLPGSKKVDAWLVFAVQEMINQFQLQFYEEGSNFEGSTSYHRLSSEFVLYTTALVYGILAGKKKDIFKYYDKNQVERLLSFGRQRYNLKREDFFPEWYLNRLFNAGVFTWNIMNNNNRIVQVGDNDNGRLIKLTPSREQEDLDNVLDHRGLVSGIMAIYEGGQRIEVDNEYLLEYSFIRALAKGKRITSPMVYCTRISQFGFYEKATLPFHKRTILFKETDENLDSLLKNINVNYYKDFGIVIFKSDRLYLSMVLCSRKNNFMAHTHNDKLSIELLVDSRYITRDPGTYVYTPEPKLRNRFRSVTAHNTINVKNTEQNLFNGVFDMTKRCRGNVIYIGKNEISAQVQYGEVKHIRHVKILDGTVEVEDYCNREFEVHFKNRFYSSGYGMLCKVDD